MGQTILGICVILIGVCYIVGGLWAWGFVKAYFTSKFQLLLWGEDGRRVLLLLLGVGYTLLGVAFLMI